MELEKVLEKIRTNDRHFTGALNELYCDQGGNYQIGNRQVSEQNARRHLGSLLSEAPPQGQQLTREQRIVASTYRPMCEREERARAGRGVGCVGTLMAMGFAAMIGATTLMSTDYEDKQVGGQPVYSHVEENDVEDAVWYGGAALGALGLLAAAYKLAKKD